MLLLISIPKASQFSLIVFPYVSLTLYFKYIKLIKVKTVKIVKTVKTPMNSIIVPVNIPYIAAQIHIEVADILTPASGKMSEIKIQGIGPAADPNPIIKVHSEAKVKY